MRRLLGESGEDLPGEADARVRLGADAATDLRTVVRMEVHFDAEFPACALHFDVGHATSRLVLRMTGIRQLLLPELAGAPLLFSELRVDDVSARQLEGVRFSVDDRENSGFRCLCSAVEVLVHGPVR